MAVSAKITYPAPQPQPQPVEAAMSPNIAVNLATNEVTIAVLETLLEPDGKRTQAPRSKALTVLLSDAQLKTFITMVLTEAQAQGKVVSGSTLNASLG